MEKISTNNPNWQFAFKRSDVSLERLISNGLLPTMYEIYTSSKTKSFEIIMFELKVPIYHSFFVKLEVANLSYALSAKLWLYSIEASVVTC